MGLSFLSFMTGYIQTRLYVVITAAGLTPWTGTDSGVPQGGAESPFLYLLVTVPLAFELARVYLGYAPYPLRALLINFADDNPLTTATRHRDPANTGLPTTTEQGSATLQLTTTYPDAHQLLVHTWKSVGLADVGIPAHTSRKVNPYTWRTPRSTWESHRPQEITTLHSQTSWNCASPNYRNLPGGTSCLRQAWHNSWKRWSTQQWIPSVAPLATPRRPTPRSTASNKAMCTTRRLAHVLPQGGHDGPLALLQGTIRAP